MRDSLASDDRYAGQLAPETMLPAQFFAALRRKARAGAERRLMIALLEDAVYCFRKHARATDPKGQQLFHDAERWIMASEGSELCSFVSVCETLALDPEYVRAGLLAWRDGGRRGGARRGMERRTTAGKAAGREEPALRKASSA